MLDRRLLMAQRPPKPPGDWDIDWKYQDGPLEDFGWGKKIIGNSKSEMKQDGFHLVSYGDFIQYICPVATCKKAVAEFDIKIVAISAGNGVRLILSNGEDRPALQIYINQVMELSVSIGDTASGTHYKTLAKVKSGDSFTLRLEYDLDGNSKIIKDGTILFDEPVAYNYYATANKIFQQDSGETVYTGIRYKFIER